MPDSNLTTSIAAIKTKITTDAPTATVDTLLSLARAAKSVGLTEDAAVEQAINSRALTLSSGASTVDMVKLSNTIKQVRDAASTSGLTDISQLTDTTNSIPATLANLTDVHTTTPTEGQNLVWDNTNSYWKPATPAASGATTGYVDTAISNLVDSSPAALNTLNELAAALNDDATFSTTVTNAIALKLNTADFTSTTNSWAGTVATNILPATDITYDLGSSTHRFKDLYLSGSTLNLGNQTISASATGIVLPELTIGTGTNKVKLVASTTGKLEQTGTNESGTVAAVVNVPTVISDLSDVHTTVATNGQILSWDNANTRWHAIDATSGGASTLSGLNDVNNATPTDGEVLTWDNTNSYWKPSASAGGGGSSVTISDTAPSTPSAGDQWFDSTAGTLSVYYNDGSSSQWIVVSGAAGPTGETGGTGAAGSSVTAYANLAAFPSSGNTNGDIAYANDTNGVYMWSNSSWKRMSIGSNSGPIFTTIPPATLQLSNDGTSTVNITANAIDDGSFPVTYDWDAYNGTTLYNASSLPPQVTAVTQSGGVFTLTGSNTTGNTGGFSFRSKASDGVTTATAITTCNLAFLGSTLLRTQASPNASINGYYGIAVAITDSYYTVSAMYEQPGGVSASGRAYIYNRSDGSLKHTLENPNVYGTGVSDGFGRSVVMNDTYTLVGTQTEDSAGYTSVGVVYVYNTSTGALLHTHQPPTADRETNLQYGAQSGMSDTHFITAGYGHDGSGGKAYVYNISTNALVYTLTNPNTYGTVANDYFGWRAVISDTYIACGAPKEDTASKTETGVVYVYNMSDGSLRHTIPNPSPSGDAYNLNYFGLGLALSETHLVVGEHGHQDGSGNENAGKIHVYNPDTGSLRYTIINPNTVDPAGDNFGQGVRVSSNYIMANAYTYHDGTNSVGKVYIFNISDGSLLHTISNPSAAVDQFGGGSLSAGAIGLHNTQFIVGAFTADPTGLPVSCGSAYIYN